jgi:Mg2+ and Co2+ transporter CorA
MPKISFTISEALYRLLDALAKQRGVSVHQLVKEIAELYLLRWASEHRYQNVDIRTLASEHRYQTNDTQVGFRTLISERRYQDADPEGSELIKKVESIEKSLAELRDAVDTLAKEFKDFAGRQQDLLNTYTSKTDQVLQRFSLLIEAIESLNEKLDNVIELFSKQQEKPKASEERSVKRGSTGTSNKQHYRKRYEDDESWVLQYADIE